MTYKLAKQLRNAGFPQTKSDGTPKNGHYIVEGKEPCFDPTLSDLIEACGDDFYSLVYALDDDWRCYSEAPMGEKFGLKLTTSDGRTPEEAVAELWIALHQK
jgi:hypothetical protein